MKNLLCILMLSLGQQLFAQGVVPLPEPDPKHDGSEAQVPLACHSNQNFSILGDKVLKAFSINLSPLFCDDKAKKFLYEEASISPLNYVHNRSRCDKVALCAGQISESDMKDAEKIINDNLANAVLLGELSQEIYQNREYNKDLLAFENEHKLKVCPEEKITFDCDVKLRKGLATVAGSLVDYPEFTRAPASEDNLDTFLASVFFAQKIPNSKLKTFNELKKTCSKKFSLKRVCSKAATRLSLVKSCDKKTNGQNCFVNEQSAWASITNDLKKKKPELFLAVEKQLCLPTRLSKTSSQVPTSTFTDTILGRGPAAVQGMTFGASTEKPYDAFLQDPQPEEPKGKGPDASNAQKPESTNNLGDSLEQTAQQNSSNEVIQSSTNRDSQTLSESFYTSMTEAAGKNHEDLSPVQTSDWNTDLMNRANTLAEEQRAIAEENKRKQAEADMQSSLQAEKNKNEEIDSLTSQISGLKAKLDEMSTRFDALNKGKKDEGDDDKTKEVSSTEAEIIDLKKKIAELELDKKKKEAEAQRIQAETKKAADRLREEKERNNSLASSVVTNLSSRNSNQSDDQGADGNAYQERDKARAGAIASSISAESGRAPASSGATNEGGAAVASSGIVLKVVGTQATPESSVVYMTPSELQRYPYRLSDNASLGEIEKMLEGSKGAAVIIGESEQVVPIMQNGVVVLDEKGRIKYKRIKIALVKNDKEKKQKIAREISSVADLKREEQKQRDLIRYQEMKKAFDVKR